jgi:polyferredoxin
MNPVDLQEKAQQDPGLLSILTGINATAGQTAAMKARRSVMSNLLTIQEQRSARRRNIALTLAVSIAVLLIVTPAIWNAVDEFQGEDPIGDLSSQLTLLGIVLIPAALAAIFAGWRHTRRIRLGGDNF